MTREEYRKKLSRIIGDESKVIELMIDLDNVINHARPPAEGAEIDDMMFTISEDGINPLNEQPTAEGAEEILNKAKAGGIPLTWLITPEFPAWNAVVSAMNEFAALHAHKIAERMPSEEEIEQWMQENRWASARQYVKWLLSRLTCSEKPNNSQKTEGGEG